MLYNFTWTQGSRNNFLNLVLKIFYKKKQKPQKSKF